MTFPVQMAVTTIVTSSICWNAEWMQTHAHVVMKSASRKIKWVLGHCQPINLLRPHTNINSKWNHTIADAFVRLRCGGERIRICLYLFTSDSFILYLFSSWYPTNKMVKLLLKFAEKTYHFFSRKTRISWWIISLKIHNFVILESLV